MVLKHNICGSFLKQALKQNSNSLLLMDTKSNTFFCTSYVLRMISLHSLSQSQSAIKPQHRIIMEIQHLVIMKFLTKRLSHMKNSFIQFYSFLPPISLSLWSGWLVTTTGYTAKLRYNFISTFNGYKNSKLYQFSHDSFP